MPETLTSSSLLLSLSSIFFFFTKTSYGKDALASNCPSHDCGAVKIHYPFWLWSDSPAASNQYCGYRSFNLTCSPEEQTIFNLPGESFYVKNISYTDQTLTLVGIDFASQTTCPRPRQNVTIHPSPMSFNRLDLNLSFYYNCSSGVIPNDIANSTACLSSVEKESYVIVEGTELAGRFYHWYDFCEEMVVMPVIASEIDRGFGGAMKDGFVLDWRQAAACGACKASGGRCGYNEAEEDYLCFCSGGSIRTNDTCKGDGKMNLGLKIGIGIVVAPTVGIVVFLLWWIIIKKHAKSESTFFWKKKTDNYRNIETFLRNHGSLDPKRYTYSDIKKTTNLFTTKLGQGGYGCVFKGKLENGCLVAVKILKGLKGNGEEFINEVATISRTSHVNIVSLLGFCFEGSHRALIYEFMPNGSLDKFIHDGGSSSHCQLGWEALYRIAVGIARGLEYLHRGCNTRILHFDIKPHNILLNEDFCPKISDFGLAKLCPQKESIISLLGARGTPGYIAPEVFSRNFGGVSHKSDVYSYGMMVLEMVGARKNVSVEFDHTSEYFPHWVYKRLELDEELGLHGITDGEANASESARKMVIVGLWCIQPNPSNRPSMTRVVEMLEGSTESFQIPPKPFLSSPSRAPVDSSSTTQSSVSL